MVLATIPKEVDISVLVENFSLRWDPAGHPKDTTDGQGGIP